MDRRSDRRPIECGTNRHKPGTILQSFCNALKIVIDAASCPGINRSVPIRLPQVGVPGQGISSAIFLLHLEPSFSAG